MGLSGQRVAIIGGSSGIGFAIAERAMAEGAEVVIGSSQQAKVDAACEQLGSKASGRAIDVHDEQSIADFFAATGEFDHLVFTAGDWGKRDPKEIVDVEADEFANTIAVRFTGALLAVKHARPHLRDGGSVVLTDGIVAHRPRKGAPLNTAMAGAVEHLVYGLAVDLAPLRVNGVCPGAIGTEVWGENAAAAFKGFTDTLPLRRLGTPQEVAEAYLFLMKCGYVTGQIVRVDGGKSLI